MWWHLQRVEDALAGRSGLAVEQVVVGSLGKLDRLELYAARDGAGLSRAEFFLSSFPRP